MDKTGVKQVINSKRQLRGKLGHVVQIRVSLRSRRLEVSPSRAPVLSFAHYVQAPATQAIWRKRES